MGRNAILFTSITVLVLASALVLVLSRPKDLLVQPGISWSRGLLSGQTVRLLNNGQYVIARWCDICEDELSYGRWAKTKDGYLLQPANAEPAFTMRLVRFRGCVVLAGPDLPANPLPANFYSRESDRCAAAL